MRISVIKPIFFKRFTPDLVNSPFPQFLWAFLWVALTWAFLRYHYEVQQLRQNNELLEKSSFPQQWAGSDPPFGKMYKIAVLKLSSLVATVLIKLANNLLQRKLLLSVLICVLAKRVTYRVPFKVITMWEVGPGNAANRGVQPSGGYILDRKVHWFLIVTLTVTSVKIVPLHASASIDKLKIGRLDTAFPSHIGDATQYFFGW